MSRIIPTYENGNWTETEFETDQREDEEDARDCISRNGETEIHI